MYANQPAPGRGAKGMWAAATLMLLAVLFGFAVRASGGGATVDSARYTFNPLLPADSQVQVLGPFYLTGRVSNVEVDVHATLSNQWGYFDLALADSAGRTTEFGREVSYYFGVDEGERWTEGSEDGSVKIPSVPAGRYSLRIEPQGEQYYEYEVRVRRDVPNGWMYLVAALLILIPPILATVRRATFEAARWAESDYAPG